MNLKRSASAVVFFGTLLALIATAPAQATPPSAGDTPSSTTTSTSLTTATTATPPPVVGPDSTATTAPPLTATTVPPLALPPDTIPPSTTPPDTTPPRIDVSQANPHFSPNGDGVRERTWVGLTADEPVVVDVVFRNRSGTARKASQLTFGPGSANQKWGGRIKKNGRWQRATDGEYVVDITATDAAGNQTSKSRTVTVDTAAPSFGWTAISPDPWGATGAVSYRFISHDSSGPLTAKATAWSRLGLLDSSAAVARPTGSVSLDWRPNYSDGSIFLPGNYFAAVTLTDQAGNKAVSPFRGFRVDRTVTTSVVRRVDNVGSRVAVTFDDCNSASAWSSILATLERYGVGGTFFCPADSVLAHPSQAVATVAAGMTIGSHTVGHAQLDHLSYSDILSRMRADQSAWWSVARATPAPYFRPPYGAYNSTVLAAAGTAGYRYTVIWDVDPNDWTNPGSAAIASRVLGSARPGSIILMHVQDQTAAALPTILSGLRDRGLQQVSLAELFHAAGWH